MRLFIFLFVIAGLFSCQHDTANNSTVTTLKQNFLPFEPSGTYTLAFIPGEPETKVGYLDSTIVQVYEYECLVPVSVDGKTDWMTTSFTSQQEIINYETWAKISVEKHGRKRTYFLFKAQESNSVQPYIGGNSSVLLFVEGVPSVYKPEHKGFKQQGANSIENN